MDNPILEKVKRTRDASEDVDEATITPEDIANLDKLIAEQNKSTADTIEGLQRASELSNTAAETVVSSIAAAAEADQTLAAIQQNAELKAQNTKIQAHHAGGGDERMVAIIEELEEDSERINKLRDKRQEIYSRSLTGIGFFDQIINEFSAIQVDAQVDAAEQKRESTARDFALHTGATLTAAQVADETKVGINEAFIEANNRKLAASADADIARSRIAQAEANGNALAQIYTMSKESLRSFMSSLQMKGDIADRKLADRRNEVATRELEIREELLPTEMQASKDRAELARLQLEDYEARRIDLTESQITQAKETVRKAEEQKLVAADRVQILREGAKTVGVDLSGMDDATVLASYTDRGAVGQTFQEYYLIGTQKNVGATPYAAWQNYKAVGGNLTNSPAAKALAAIEQELESGYADGGTAVSDAKRESDFDAKVAEKAELWLSNIVTGDTSNPYHAPTWDILKNAEVIKDTQLYQKLLQDYPDGQVNPQELMNLAIQGVQAKSIGSDEAVEGLKIIFDTAVATNDTLFHGYELFSMPEQNNYFTNVAVPKTGFEKLTGVAAGLGRTGLAVWSGIYTDTADPDTFSNRQVQAAIRSAHSMQVVDMTDSGSIRAHMARILAVQPPKAPIDEE